MMDRDAAKEALSVFLERSGQRKTSERFAVLDAICQMEASFSVEELENFCQMLPRYKRPKEIIFNTIPRNATGKIEKPKLRKMYGADQLVAQENRS